MTFHVFFAFASEPLKRALRLEVSAWKQLYGKALNGIYKAKMDQIVEFEDEIMRKLSHQITDLEDVRLAMAALESVRQQQIGIDMSLGPIEVRAELVNDELTSNELLI